MLRIRVRAIHATRAVCVLVVVCFGVTSCSSGVVKAPSAPVSPVQGGELTVVSTGGTAVLSGSNASVQVFGQDESLYKTTDGTVRVRSYYDSGIPEIVVDELSGQHMLIRPSGLHRYDYWFYDSAGEYLGGIAVFEKAGKYYVGHVARVPAYAGQQITGELISSDAAAQPGSFVLEADESTNDDLVDVRAIPENLELWIEAASVRELWQVGLLAIAGGYAIGDGRDSAIKQNRATLLLVGKLLVGVIAVAVATAFVASLFDQAAKMFDKELKVNNEVREQAYLNLSAMCPIAAVVASRAASSASCGKRTDNGI